MRAEGKNKGQLSEVLKELRYQNQAIRKQLEQEIARRKRAEETLEITQERYKLAARSAKGGVWDWDIKTGAFFLDPNVKSILGYQDEEIPNDLEIWAANVHPEDREAVMAAAQDCLDGKIPMYVFEHRMIHKDGSIRWVLVRGQVIRDGKGNAIRMVGTDRDITEYKRTAEALQESEALFKTLAEKSPNMIFLNFQGKVVYANNRCEEMMGYRREEFLAADFDFLTLIAPQYRARIRENFATHMQGNEISPYEYKLVAKDGTLLDSIITTKLIDYEGGKAILGIVTDITERKQIEERMIHLERLHALGEMSAGVSHNLNNILTGIFGPAQLLQWKTDDPDLLLEINDILTATRRAIDLVHRLHLSTRGVAEKELHPVQVNQVIRDAIRVARPRWRDGAEAQGTHIEIVDQLAEIPPVLGTESRLSDVFINLIFNAVDAMPEGGRITIKTRITPDGIGIIVQDTGIGMDGETRRRVFEPFFTSKADVGSGLGLSTVYSTITQWGGSIQVESKPGEGTVFTLLLPACIQDPQEEQV